MSSGDKAWTPALWGQPDTVFHADHCRDRDLEPDALDEAWRRFGDSLHALHAVGKLGAVVFQWPPWFTAKRPNREIFETLHTHIPNPVETEDEVDAAEGAAESDPPPAAPDRDETGAPRRRPDVLQHR